MTSSGHHIFTEEQRALLTAALNRNESLPSFPRKRESRFPGQQVAD